MAPILQRLTSTLGSASLLGRLAQLRYLGSTRGLASAAADAIEVLTVPGSSSGTTFVAGPQFRWGAAVAIEGDTVEGVDAKYLAVLRDAFATTFNSPRSLADTLACLAPNTLALNSALAYPETRMLVDKYVRTPHGDYALQEGSIDLMRFLRRENIIVDFVPDLALAKTGGYNAARGRSSGGSKQSSNEVLMVAPTAFTFNQQAAQDNYFMHSFDDNAASQVAQQVCREFAGLYHQLTEVNGVKVQLFSHSNEHSTPDACFPNNWFSTHPVGEAGGGVNERTLVLYPMKCPNRAAERRADTTALLRSKGYTRLLDLTSEESGDSPAYFEGTGALVNDRINGVAYVALSERAHPRLAQKWADEMGYRELVTFHSTDAGGHPVYHTNVMMAIGTDVAIVCAESVEDEKERTHLLSSLRKTHEVVEITRAQMDGLCGNALEVQDGNGLPAMAMSTQAYNAFTADQRSTILRHCVNIIHSPIDTLERIGGGGVRCTLGEIF